MIRTSVRCILVYFLLHATGSAQSPTANSNEKATKSVGPICLTQVLIEARAPQTPDQIATAKSKAERIRDALRAGGSWTDLAQGSPTELSAPQIKSLGCMQRSALAAPIRDMKIGDVSDVLITKLGFAVLQVWGDESPSEQTAKPFLESGVRGRIVGAGDRIPISNAYIVVHRDGAADAHVRTDSGGRYAMALPVGVYDVLISADGFSPTTRKIQIGSEGMMVYDALLEFNTLGMEFDAKVR